MPYSPLQRKNNTLYIAPIAWPHKVKTTIQYSAQITPIFSAQITPPLSNR